MNDLKPLALLSNLVVVALVLTSAPIAPAQTYRVTDLGTINNDPRPSYPAGINRAGQVTGWSFSGSQIHAARYTYGLVEDLGTIPGGSKSLGLGINDFGQVTGDSEYTESTIRHAVLFSNGTATDLGVLPGWGNFSRGNGINNAGEVVGHSGPHLSTSNTRAFIWDAANGMRDLGTLGGNTAKAFSINDSGVVTGLSQIGTGFPSDHAFIWDAAGGMRDLGVIAGSSSSGNFINANGHVAGWSSISTDNRRHAFLHDGTTMHDLGAIGDNDFFTDRSEAYGVNIHDVVVGTTYRPFQGGAAYAIAFVYRNGQMLDLEQLVDASGANYRLYTATGINDAGQIAVDAIRIGATNEIRATLLTPNQELVSAVSRKTHGGAGAFDVNLTLSGQPAVECRSGVSGHMLVLTFMNDVTGGNASVTQGAATIVGNPSYSGKTMMVALTGVNDGQTVTVMLSDVIDSFGQTLPPTSIRMSVLRGDSNGDGFVNAGDALQTRNYSGQPTDQTNLRSDVNADGFVNSGDTLVVRANSGSGLP